MKWLRESRFETFKCPKRHSLSLIPNFLKWINAPESSCRCNDPDRQTRGTAVCKKIGKTSIFHTIVLACVAADDQKLPAGGLTTPPCCLLQSTACIIHNPPLSEESLCRVLSSLPLTYFLNDTFLRQRTSTCTKCNAEITGQNTDRKLQPLKPISGPYLKIVPHTFTLAHIQSELLLSPQAAIKKPETSET